MQPEIVRIPLALFALPGRLEITVRNEFSVDFYAVNQNPAAFFLVLCPLSLKGESEIAVPGRRDRVADGLPVVADLLDGGCRVLVLLFVLEPGQSSGLHIV